MKLFEISQNQNNLNKGWRAQTTGVGFGATEGNGIYIAKTPELAKFFGSKINEVWYKTPRKLLIVHEEPLPLLQEEFPLYDPIEKTDSVWIKFNKMAAQQAASVNGVTEDNYDADVIAQHLTTLIKDAGYDAIDVTSGGESWVVLLDRNLFVSKVEINTHQ